MVKIRDISEKTIQAVVNQTAMESDIYRIAHGIAFDNMNNRAQSFEWKARNSLMQGDIETAKNLVEQANTVVENYEKSPLFIEGKTSGIRGHIERLEGKVNSYQRN